MSGGEPSSIKQFSRCAAGMPVLSRSLVGAWEFLLDFRVYGLILRVIYIIDMIWEVKMEHLALYRKYRPRTFEDVCGQEHITSVLRYESAHGRLSHAYLFCGPRGTGKTTCAKILSKAVNCDSPVNGDPCGKCPKCKAVDDGSATDIVEMDAASNTGVEYIRDIRDEVTYTPAMMKKRVYIIDEVHMLSMGAFNALLKTLEEPPEHVVFVLATTEQHKLPATIISRCQRFDFRRITVDNIASRLKYIAGEENIVIEDEAAGLLARQAQGGMRDAINLLELCAGGGHEVTSERVRSVLGITGLENAYRCALAVKERNFEALFSAVADVVSSSKDVMVFWQELVSFWRDMLVAKSTRNVADYLDLTVPDFELLRDAAAKFTTAELVYHSSLLDEALVSMQKIPQNKRNFAEITLVKLATPELLVNTDALLARLSALEDKIKLLGSVPVAARTVAAEPDVTESKTVEEKGDPEKTDRPTQSAPKAPLPKKSDDSVREVSDKSEIIERVKASIPMIAGFLTSSRILVSTDRRHATVQVGNPMAQMMLTKAESMQALTEAFILSGVCDSGCEIKVETAEIKEEEKSPLDELDIF